MEIGRRELIVGGRFGAGFGSHAVMLAEAYPTPARLVEVDRVTAVADCGRVVSPDSVAQQIEGGLLFAMAAGRGLPIGNALSAAGGARRRTLPMRPAIPGAAR